MSEPAEAGVAPAPSQAAVSSSGGAGGGGGGGGGAPLIAREVGSPLQVNWVTANCDNSGIFGEFTIRTAICLGEGMPETVYAVMRTLVDLLRFRLAFCLAKPYLFIGELPPEESLHHDADEILAFVHIVVNNPALCDSVLTWHLLTTPQAELDSIAMLPGTFSVFKNVLFGFGSFFGPTEIPRIEDLKVEVLSPAMANNEDLRNEMFRVLDVVIQACEIARGFQYSRIKFNQRGVMWERLRESIVNLVKQHDLLNESSSVFEQNLRDMACHGAVFWPWTMDATIADEKLRLKQVAQHQKDLETNKQHGIQVNNNDDNDNDRCEMKSGQNKKQFQALAHPSIRLGKSFLSAANVTEAVAKQTSNLDLYPLVTAITLMTKVDFACACSSRAADEHFRESSEELKTLVSLFTTVKALAATATNGHEKQLREQLDQVGKAAKIILEKVSAMQTDLREQMQSVRMTTHQTVCGELSRWSMGQGVLWAGAANLAGEVKKLIVAELDGGAASPITGNTPETQFQESLPLFKIRAGGSVENENVDTSKLHDGGGGGEKDVTPGRESRSGTRLTFGPPVLEDVSMAFNLQSLPMKTVRRKAINQGNVNEETAKELHRIVPQPRRERQVTQTQAMKVAVLDDPFART